MINFNPKLKNTFSQIFSDLFGCFKNTLTCDNKVGTSSVLSTFFKFSLTTLLFFLFTTQAHALTVSGTLYSDEGITPIASETIKLAVGTSTPPSIHSTTTDASGDWYFTFSSLATGTPVVAWVDGNASVRGSIFTKSSSTVNSIPDLNIYQNRVIISHEGATTSTSTSIRDLAFYDNDNDSDIQYNASSTAATFDVNAGNKLYINTGKLFIPGGEVTVYGNAGSGVDGSMHIATDATYLTSGTTTLAGNLSASSTALVGNHGTIYFNASTTGKTITATQPIGNLKFGGTGTYTFATNATTTDITIDAGATLVAPADNITITGDYTNNGTFTHNSGTTTFGNEGTVWTARSAAEANSWFSVTYGNGLFVAVSNTGTNRVMTSPDGITWTARAAAEANSWKSVTYGNGLFVAVSADGTNRVMTSPDGVTWTARAATEANQWTSITYGNGLFVAVSADGTNRVMTSLDGITWTSHSVSAVTWLSVTYGNGLFVSVSYSGAYQVMTSPTVALGPPGLLPHQMLGTPSPTATACLWRCVHMI
ncbi:hypothetical protein H6784_02380 [Candidatus Nomurabacteria bacterium]|nr:hypothetical protein [Candidatus Nomurabacteria bacterium]